jgi:hypothetical protein
MLEFNRSIEFSDGRYIVRLPWNNEVLSCTYENEARMRLNQVLRLLLKKDILADYDRVIKE